jgi:hypothetical protein
MSTLIQSEVVSCQGVGEKDEHGKPGVAITIELQRDYPVGISGDSVFELPIVKERTNLLLRENTELKRFLSLEKMYRSSLMTENNRLRQDLDAKIREIHYARGVCQNLDYRLKCLSYYVVNGISANSTPTETGNN